MIAYYLFDKNENNPNINTFLQLWSSRICNGKTLQKQPIHSYELESTSAVSFIDFNFYLTNPLCLKEMSPTQPFANRVTYRILYGYPIHNLPTFSIYP